MLKCLICETVLKKYLPAFLFNNLPTVCLLLLLIHSSTIQPNSIHKKMLIITNIYYQKNTLIEAHERGMQTRTKSAGVTKYILLLWHSRGSSSVWKKHVSTEVTSAELPSAFPKVSKNMAPLSRGEETQA